MLFNSIPFYFISDHVFDLLECRRTSEKESFIRFFHRILRLFSYNVFDSFFSNNRDQLLSFC